MVVSLTKSCPRLRGKWTRSGRKGNGSEQPSYFTIPPQLRLRSAERWLEYGRLAALLLHMCQDIRVNALVGTRSPYSLPFVILPVPARSPFRFIRHRTHSTPNLAASPTGRARLESPARGGAFWHCTPCLHCTQKAPRPGSWQYAVRRID